MNQGFIKVAAGTPQVTVADCKADTTSIRLCGGIFYAAKRG